MRIRTWRAAAATCVIAATAAGCGDSKPPGGVPPAAENTGAASQAGPSTHAIATLPTYFNGPWHVCAVPAGTHVPMNEEFTISEMGSGTNLYLLVPTNPPAWGKGWASLVMAKAGSDEANMPPKSWEMQTGCEQGAEQPGDPNTFEPTANTIRLRGAVCLPNGIPDHVNATCSTGKKQYHEIVIFVRPERAANDPAHLLLEYCGRHELKNNLDCPETLAPPAQEGTEAIMEPHPGHVHGDPP